MSSHLSLVKKSPIADEISRAISARQHTESQEEDRKGKHAHSFTHSPIHPFTHSPIHPFTHSPIHPFTHSPIHPFPLGARRSVVHTFRHSDIHTFIPGTWCQMHDIPRSQHKAKSGGVGTAAILYQSYSKPTRVTPAKHFW